MKKRIVTAVALPLVVAGGSLVRDATAFQDVEVWGLQICEPTTKASKVEVTVTGIDSRETVSWTWTRDDADSDFLNLSSLGDSAIGVTLQPSPPDASVDACARYGGLGHVSGSSISSQNTVLDRQRLTSCTPCPTPRQWSIFDLFFIVYKYVITVEEPRHIYLGTRDRVPYSEAWSELTFTAKPPPGPADARPPIMQTYFLVCVTEPSGRAALVVGRVGKRYTIRAGSLKEEGCSVSNPLLLGDMPPDPSSS